MARDRVLHPSSTGGMLIELCRSTQHVQ
jgi:hypothetical protein